MQPVKCNSAKGGRSADHDERIFDACESRIGLAVIFVMMCFDGAGRPAHVRDIVPSRINFGYLGPLSYLAVQRTADTSRNVEPRLTANKNIKQSSFANFHLI